MDIVQAAPLGQSAYRAVFPKKPLFAFQPIVINFDTAPKTGDYFYATVPDHGRRVLRMWLDIGSYNLNVFEVLIGETLVWSWTGEYIAIHNSLRNPASKTLPSQVLVPLPKFFPVVPGTRFRIKVDGATGQKSFKLVADWVYDSLPVDGDYPINQVQTMQLDPSQRNLLTFRNVVKELIFAIQDQGQSPLVFTDQVASMQLTFSGVDKFNDVGAFFKYVQPMMYHTSNELGVYLYSFCVNPEDDLPTGGANFSRVNYPTLTVNLLNNLAKTMRVYAVSYNVLRVQNGTATLVFDNL